MLFIAGRCHLGRRISRKERWYMKLVPGFPARINLRIFYNN